MQGNEGVENGKCNRNDLSGNFGGSQIPVGAQSVSKSTIKYLGERKLYIYIYVYERRGVGVKCG